VSSELVWFSGSSGIQVSVSRVRTFLFELNIIGEYQFRDGLILLELRIQVSVSSKIDKFSRN
jgi:hypothetical protein